MSHVRRKHDYAGKALFEDTNAWVAVSEIFTNMVLDLDLKATYLVIDALGECVTDLPKLLDLIVRTSSSSARVKWLLSSWNEVHIEQKLRSVDAQARLSLELKQKAEQMSRAVDVYIDDKLSRLESLEEAPTGLHQLYDRMVGQIQQLAKRNSEICRLLLSTVSSAYRPLHLAGIGSLCGLSGQIPALTKNVRKFVTMGGSFLTVRDDQVYHIRQSAKD